MPNLNMDEKQFREIHGSRSEPYEVVTQKDRRLKQNKYFDEVGHFPPKVHLPSFMKGFV